MQKLVLNPSKKIVIEFEGKEYSCVPPKLGDQIELEKKLDAANEKGHGGSVLMQDLLVSCGLPKEMVKKLDVDQLNAVIEVLKPAKKK